MESPVTKTIVTKTVVTISVEAISAEARLVERRSSIEAACPARTRTHATESVATTHVAAKPASTSESAAVSAGSASPAAAHLCRGWQRRRDQVDRHNDDRRRMKKAMHNKIISLPATDASQGSG
jgi:hypothetical protein